MSHKIYRDSLQDCIYASIKDDVIICLILLMTKLKPLLSKTPEK